VPVLSLNTYIRRLENLRASLPEMVESSNELLEESYMVAYLVSEGGDANVRGSEFAWLRDHWVGVRGYGVIQDSGIVARLDKFFL